MKMLGAGVFADDRAALGQFHHGQSVLAGQPSGHVCSFLGGELLQGSGRQFNCAAIRRIAPGIAVAHQPFLPLLDGFLNRRMVRRPWIGTVPERLAVQPRHRVRLDLSFKCVLGNDPNVGA